MTLNPPASLRLWILLTVSACAEGPGFIENEHVKLEGRVARIRYGFTYSGDTGHPPTHQELPAVFVDADLPNLTFYRGDAPWTGAPLTSRVPGWPNEKAVTTEPWAAYVDDKGWGHRSLHSRDL